MGATLPNSGDVFLPEVPVRLRNSDQEIYEYLTMLRRATADALRGQFDNSNYLIELLNEGTSGTFTISSGGSIIVTSGIVTTVTS